MTFFCSDIVNGTANGLSEEQIEKSRQNLDLLERICEGTTRSFSSKFNFAGSGKMVSEHLAQFLAGHTPGKYVPLNAESLLDAIDVSQ